MFFCRRIVVRRMCFTVLNIGGWGLSQFVKPPTGKSFRFVRASGRGEAKLCGRARGDSIVKLGLL